MILSVLIFKHYSMLPYLILYKKKITNVYLYITFKHYNTKLKKQINKKEHYCTRKIRMVNLVLLLTRFSVWVLSFCVLKYSHTNS